MFKYFTLEEFLDSSTAKQKNIHNIPSFEIVENLKTFTRTALDPLRDAWGSAIDVTSGYRNQALNKAVGGSDTSAHPLGWAVDLIPRNGKIDEFFNFTVEWFTLTGIKFDQIILERDNKGNRWVHIGLYNKQKQQREEIRHLQK